MGSRDANKTRELLLEALERNRMNISKSVKELGLHRSDYYWHLESDDYFKERVEWIKESLTDEVEEALIFNALEQKNQKAIEYYLNNKAKNRGYNLEKQETSKDINIVIQPTTPYQQELLEQLIS